MLEAVERDSGIVGDDHVAAGLDRLLGTTNEMTRVLLGATVPRGTTGFAAN
jgi:hypothetical protein